MAQNKFDIYVYAHFYADTLINYWIISTSWIIKIVGLLCIVIFGGMTEMLPRLLFRKTALIINRYGIIDSSTVGGEAGKVKWEQVTGIGNAGITVYKRSRMLYRRKDWICK